jgi:predicted RNA-binding Zn-ribbon protein involved in translation (DUF1610 family)
MEDVEKEVTLENFPKYYSHTFYCRNCGERNYRQIKKGKLLADVAFSCDKCGCTVTGRR